MSDPSEAQPSESPDAQPAPRTARALAREHLTAAILGSAAGQLADVGPAALSVRAVARDLGMVSSAVYRYFPSRDALLTALLIEAYDDLGDAVEAADRTRARDDLAGRWSGICHALRDWARAHPHRYALLYGSPVPGYAAPDDTVTSAIRVTMALLGVFRDAQVVGRRPVATHPLSAAEQAATTPVRGLTDPELDEAYAARGLLAWATVFGNISLEVFGHMYRGILDYDAHFDQIVGQLASDLGLAGGLDSGVAEASPDHEPGSTDAVSG